jgi:hypothetical protein
MADIDPSLTKRKRLFNAFAAIVAELFLKQPTIPGGLTKNDMEYHVADTPK